MVSEHGHGCQHAAFHHVRSINIASRNGHITHGGMHLEFSFPHKNLPYNVVEQVRKPPYGIEDVAADFKGDMPRFEYDTFPTSACCFLANFAFYGHASTHLCGAANTQTLSCGMRLVCVVLQEYVCFSRTAESPHGWATHVYVTTETRCKQSCGTKWRMAHLCPTIYVFMRRNILLNNMQ